MRINRASAFILAIVVTFLTPLVIPGMGIDYPYFFIMGLVLFAWFIMKWDSVKSLGRKGKNWEIILGGAVISSDYILNIVASSKLGLTDMLIIFSALVVAFYGFKSFRLFWVPATYGIVLLLGYELEAIIPNFVALQDWMASVMGSSMQVLGITASVSGHVVYLNAGANILGLNVEGDCTGIQGILAFGMLSTMAVLDVKAKLTKLIPLFVFGFLGAFAINIVRLFGVFLTFEFLGPDLGAMVHAYLGYLLFIAWVMVFWSLAFKYLMPRARPSPPA